MVDLDAARESAFAAACIYLGISRDEMAQVLAPAFAGATFADYAHDRDYYIDGYNRFLPRVICKNIRSQFEFAEAFSLLSSIRSPMRYDVLDFGCATAARTYALRDNYAELWLCDLPNRVQDFVAWRRHHDQADQVRTCTPETLRRDRPFALINATDVLEHLRDPTATFLRLDALLAPGGFFMHNSPWASLGTDPSHLPEAEIDWHRPGGGAEILTQRFDLLAPLPYGGLYRKRA